MRRALGCVCFWLAMYLLSSCRLQSRSYVHDQLREAERIKWDSVEEKHAEQKQQHEQQRSDQQVVVRRKTTPSPAGPIVEEEYVLTLSELRDTSGVVTVSGSQLVTGGEVEREREKERQEVKQADTRAGWPSWWWALLLVPAAVLAWFLRRRIRAFIPWG